MTDSLFDTAPDFDQPIAVLKHCHDRIRKQLRTMRKLVDYLPESGADADAIKAAASVLKYFNNAAHLHHEDEEQDLLPMLFATAVDRDAALLQALMPQILDEHKNMEAKWQAISPQLTAITTGASVALDAVAVHDFADLYTAHMEREESHIAPMAKRLFSDAQMTTFGNAMRARRGMAA